jgi:hypothetical protein
MSQKCNLPAFNGDPSWTLTMPARYVIGRDGIILYAEVNLDYIPAAPGRKTCYRRRAAPPAFQPDRSSAPASQGWGAANQRHANSLAGCTALPEICRLQSRHRIWPPLMC